MKTQELNQLIINIINKKNKISQMLYADPKYDQLEEEIHHLEDEIVEKFGDEFDNALRDIHKKYKIRSDILLPTAYLANEYSIQKNNGEAKYDVDYSEGVIVDIETLPNKLVRMVLLPNPPRLILQHGKGLRETVWESGN